MLDSAWGCKITLGTHVFFLCMCVFLFLACATQVLPEDSPKRQDLQFWDDVIKVLGLGLRAFSQRLPVPS